MSGVANPTKLIIESHLRSSLSPRLGVTSGLIKTIHQKPLTKGFRESVQRRSETSSNTQPAEGYQLRERPQRLRRARKQRARRERLNAKVVEETLHEERQDRATSQAPKTYVYKLIDDYDGAPCISNVPDFDVPAALTLAICKPMIRTQAQVGDRILGITSKALAAKYGYPLDSVIYAAVVDQVLDGKDYYKLEFAHRLDCIYSFSETTGKFARVPTTGIHSCPTDIERDLGVYPMYKRSRVLVCKSFRYFGKNSRRIPDSCPQLLEVSRSLTQGHRVYTGASTEGVELDILYRQLWMSTTRYTPLQLQSDHKSCKHKIR